MLAASLDIDRVFHSQVLSMCGVGALHLCRSFLNMNENGDAIVPTLFVASST
jgi:hypothetical protein